MQSREGECSMSADMDIWGVPARKVVEQAERQADIGQDPVASVMTPSEPIEASNSECICKSFMLVKRRLGADCVSMVFEVPLVS